MCLEYYIGVCHTDNIKVQDILVVIEAQPGEVKRTNVPVA